MREVHMIEHGIERDGEEIDITVYYTVSRGHPMFFDKVYGNWLPPEPPEVEFTGKIEGVPCDFDLTDAEYDELTEMILSRDGS